MNLTARESAPGTDYAPGEACDVIGLLSWERGKALFMTRCFNEAQKSQNMIVRDEWKGSERDKEKRGAGEKDEQARRETGMKTRREKRSGRNVIKMQREGRGDEGRKSKKETLKTVGEMSQKRTRMAELAN